MKTFKTGTAVKLVRPVVAGVVLGGKLSEAGDSIDYRVRVFLPSGEANERYFSAEELEELTGENAEKLGQIHAAWERDDAERRALDEANAARHRKESGE